MKIGRTEVLAVLDGWIRSRLPSTKPLPDADSIVWQEQHGMFQSDGMIESTVGGFLVRIGERLVLVDAGAGQDIPGGYRPPVVDVESPEDPIAGSLRTAGLTEDQLRRLATDLEEIRLVQGGLPASLGALGVQPQDVTDVIFTHLHFDHIGWASASGVAFFPNATIRCAAADLAHFLPGTPEESFLSHVYGSITVGERLNPVLERIETWDSDQTLFRGLDVRLAAGHTPGSSVVVISDGAERAMLLGDIVHCPLELMDDDFDLLVDHDQNLANAVREAYARELEGSDVRVAASHFPGLRFGRLLPGKGVRHWNFDMQ